MVVGITVVVAIFIFSFFIPTLITSIEKTEREYVGVIGEYSLTQLPEQIEKQISAGLTQVNESGEVIPLIAERWTTENEGKTYRFVLKNNIFWQDGEPVTPDDVQYNFSDSETISTANDIVFKLPDAYAPFPSVVSKPFLKFESKKKFLFFSEPTIIGIGKHSVSDITMNGNTVTEMVVDSPTKRTTYRFYLTESEAVTAYKHGSIDKVLDLSKKHDVMDWGNTNVATNIQFDKYLAVFFNNSHPNFEKNIRQGLAYALDKPSDNTRALGPINPLSWAYLEGGKNYNKDWERGSERLLSKLPPQKLELELRTTPLFIDEAESIKSQWESFGDKVTKDCNASTEIDDKEECQKLDITVSIKVANFPDTNDFQLLLIGQEIQLDPDQYRLWHSSQGTNFTQYKNTRIDTLLEKGRTTTEASERKEIYQEFQQFFLEDSPAIFLRHLESYDISRK